jgi:excisionase family DNA binding protein
MPDPEALLNIQQVADYLQLNHSTVYQWAQLGRLPAIKLGGRWRFRRADIEEWLDAQARQPVTAPDLHSASGSASIERLAHDAW